MKLLLFRIRHRLALNLRRNLFEVLVPQLHCGHLEIVLVFAQDLRLLALTVRSPALGRYSAVVELFE